MIEKNSEPTQLESKPRDDGVELENQFILRVPNETALVLNEAISSGNLKERFTIQLDTELRYGEVHLDEWKLYVKVVDLPTIIECLKTIDGKSFYKSSDICQMMICKEDPEEEEKESPSKGKKKDPNKVDKKFLWPHGITPPCKNIRKRRFRKTLKKKNVEAPEIEKEVKRLLRIDNDAVKVEFEIIREDIDKRGIDNNTMENNDGDETFNDYSINDEMKKTLDTSQDDINIESDGEDMEDRRLSAPTAISGVGEHDIFGEEVSSSDDEDNNDRVERSQNLEDVSQLSADDSQMSAFSVEGRGDNHYDKNEPKRPTEFNKSMFNYNKDDDNSNSKLEGSNSNIPSTSGFYDAEKRNLSSGDDSNLESLPIPDNSSSSKIPTKVESTSSKAPISKELSMKIYEAQRVHRDIEAEKKRKEIEIISIQNPTLKQRMKETLNKLENDLHKQRIVINNLEAEAKN